MKIRPVGADLFHPDRQEEANGRFPQFCERAYKTILSNQVPATHVAHV